MKKILFCFIVLLSSSAYSFDKDIYTKVEKEVDKLEQKCLDKHHKDFSTNASMKRGTTDSNECLEEYLKKEINVAYDKETAKKVWEEFQIMAKSAREFYWSYYNESKYCNGPCGTIEQLIYLGRWTDLIKKSLADMMYLNKTKDLP